MRRANRSSERGVQGAPRTNRSGARAERAGALVALIVATSSQRGGDGSLSRFLATFAVTALACIVVLPLYPQLLYKPQRRDLSIDEEGYATQIGKRSGSRRWDEVASIDEGAGAIVLTTTSGNAMIVP